MCSGLTKMISWRGLVLSGFRVPVAVGCTKTVAENRVIDSSGCERFCPYCVC